MNRSIYLILFVGCIAAAVFWMKFRKTDSTSTPAETELAEPRSQQVEPIAPPSYAAPEAQSSGPLGGNIQPQNQVPQAPPSPPTLPPEQGDMLPPPAPPLNVPPPDAYYPPPSPPPGDDFGEAPPPPPPPPNFDGDGFGDPSPPDEDFMPPPPPAPIEEEY